MQQFRAKNGWPWNNPAAINEQKMVLLMLINIDWQSSKGTFNLERETYNDLKKALTLNSVQDRSKVTQEI